jgi:hypothetical protein
MAGSRDCTFKYYNRQYELHAAHDIVITNSCRSYRFWGSQYWEQFRPNNDIRKLQRSDLVVCKTTQTFNKTVTYRVSDCNSVFAHANEQTQDMCVGVQKNAWWDGAISLELPKLKQLRSMVYKIRFQHTQCIAYSAKKVAIYLTNSGKGTIKSSRAAW